MLLGVMNFLNQDLSHFDGIDASYGWNFWICLATMVVCCFCVSGIAFDAANDEEAIKAKLGEKLAQRALPPRPAQRSLPTRRRAPGAGGGAAAGDDEEEDEGATEGERLGAAMSGLQAKAKGFGGGLAAKAQQMRAASPERGGGAAAPKRPPPALPPARPGTPPRSVPARP
jgi:hypothetical protein